MIDKTFRDAVLTNEYRDWVIITHKNCRDGLLSYLACLMFAKNNNLKEPYVIFMQHGDDFDIHSFAENYYDSDVLIADFSFDEDTLKTIYNISNEILLLDHHITAEEKLNHLDFCYFDKTKCGGRLVWEYLFQTRQVPKLAEYIEDRDLWNWKLPNSKEVSAYLSTIPLQDTDRWIELLLDDSKVDKVIDMGKAILDYQNTIVESKSDKAQENELFNINGYLVPCINSNTLISEIGNELAQIYTFAVQYFFTDDKIVFSLRSEGDSFDVSELAKKFGGGGHFNAAGFSFDLKNFDYEDFFVFKRLT